MPDAENPANLDGVPAGGRDSKSYLDQLEQTAKRAKELLKTLETTSAKAGEANTRIADFLTKASEAQVRADSEALRANQAKVSVEDHSNTVSKLKGNLEADAAAIANKRAEIEASVQGFVSLRATAESDVTAIASARKTVDEAVKGVAEISGKVTSVQAGILETKKNIEELSHGVREESKTVKSDVAQVTSTKEIAAALLAEIQKANTTAVQLQERAKSAHASIEAFEKTAKTKTDSASDLVEKSLDLQEKVANYEKALAGLQAEFKMMKDKVEGLLPGATSAGLASAFLGQRKHFEAERQKWANILFGSLVLLMAVVLFVGWKFEAKADDWGAIARHLLQRLPYMVPPVWMAVYAGRQHMLATRMEAEYATKEVVSTSFEGYKREMASDPDTAKALADNVLAVIAHRPGKVYEGTQQDVTAFTPAIDAAQKLVREAVDAVAAQIKSKMPAHPGEHP